MKRVGAVPGSLLAVSVLALSVLACAGGVDDPVEASVDDPTSPAIPPPTIPSATYRLRVNVMTTGTDLDADGYVVRIQFGYSGGLEDMPIGTTDSVLFQIKQHPPVEGWFIQLIWIGAELLAIATRLAKPEPWLRHAAAGDVLRRMRSAGQYVDLRSGDAALGVHRLVSRNPA